MKKHSGVTGINDDAVKKYYILTRPAKLSDLTLDELEEDYEPGGWREKSRQLQVRRWRKIRHQVA